MSKSDLNSSVGLSREDWVKENEKDRVVIHERWISSDVMPPASAGLAVISLWAVSKVKRNHAVALLVLTGSSTPEERDTWPSKAKYAALQVDAAAAGTDVSVDGYGLSDIQKANVKQALIDGETINEYLAKTAARVVAFESLAFFAEGFKRKTERAIESAETVESVGLIMDQAAADMAKAIEAFKVQINA